MADDTPMSHSDAILARGYASAIKPLLGVSGPIGKNQLIVTAPPTQRGIAAGSDVDAAITNYQIYTFSDILQASDNAVLGDSIAGSYIDQLQNYANHVSGNASEANKKWYKEANGKFATAAKELRQTIKDAKKDWEEAKSGLEFEQWAFLNYPEVQVGRTALNIAQANLQAAELVMNGPLAPILAGVRNQISNALNQQGPMPGYNQRAMPLRSSPKDLTYVPLYTLDTYSEIVEHWYEITKGKTPDQVVRDQTVKIDIDQGEKTTWEDYGFKEVRGGGSVGFWPFFYADVFYADVNASSTVERRELDIKGLESKVDLTLAMVGIMKFSIKAGLWDAVDIKTNFPTIRSDAPPDILGPKFARLTSLLVGYDVQLKINFGAELIDRVSKIYDEVKKSGGIFSLFGIRIPVNAGGGGEVRNGYSFDGIKWDKTNGSLVLTPSTGQLTPTFLGAVAQRFE